MDARRSTGERRDRLGRTTRFSGYAYKNQEQNEQTNCIEPRKGDRRYVRRNTKGEFKKEVSVGRSLAADRKRTAKSKVKKGQGDRGEVTK